MFISPSGTEQAAFTLFLGRGKFQRTFFMEGKYLTLFFHGGAIVLHLVLGRGKCSGWGWANVLLSPILPRKEDPLLNSSPPDYLLLFCWSYFVQGVLFCRHNLVLAPRVNCKSCVLLYTSVLYFRLFTHYQFIYVLTIFSSSNTLYHRLQFWNRIVGGTFNKFCFWPIAHICVFKWLVAGVDKLGCG